jgi:hypothetical protein
MIRANRDPVTTENVGVKAILIYHLLNLAFHGLHISVIAFNLFGWALKETRFANLLLILLTLGSWYIFGRWLGVGYCPITDWHWRIRRRMGVTPIPDSYIKLVLDGISGKDLDHNKINALTLVATLVSGMTSLVMNVLDWI